MASRLTIRFQHWVLGTFACIVAGLLAVLLGIVLGKLEARQVADASNEFDQTARTAARRINDTLRDYARLTDVLAAKGAQGLMEDPAQQTALARIMAADAAHESLTVTLDNDDHLSIRRLRVVSPADRTANIPADARLVMRRVRHDPSSGRRLKQRLYLDAKGRVLEQRDDPDPHQSATGRWYRETIDSGRTLIAKPVVFEGAVRLTVSAPLPDKRGAVLTGISLARSDATLASLDLSPNAVAVLIDDEQHVMALRMQGTQSGSFVVPTDRLLRLPDSGHPFLMALAQAVQRPSAGMGTAGPPQGAQHRTAQREGTSVSTERLDILGEAYIGSVQAIESVPGARYKAIVVAPLSDFTSGLDQRKRTLMLIAAPILGLTLVLAWFITRGPRRAIRALEVESDRIQRLDFSTPAAQPRSFLREVDQLIRSQQAMREAIARREQALESSRQRLKSLAEIGVRLGREADLDKLAAAVAGAAREVVHCSLAVLRLRTDDDRLQAIAAVGPLEWAMDDLALYDPETGAANDHRTAVHATLSGETCVVDDLRTDTRRWTEYQRLRDPQRVRSVRSIVAAPLMGSNGRALGVLMLFNASDPRSGEVIAFDAPTVQCVEALAAQAAVAIENHKLLADQRRLMDAIIQILAGAIDAKSAYTGGHCARVPELAFMLAEAACEVSHGPLADFRFTCEEQWHEFRIGAWLHDCGKVTTPEYVVDKATKLETIYNRIHELRTRFEVLLRDAHIDAWRAIDSGTPRDTAWAAFNTRRQQLADDFAFVAQCNIGAESMAPDHVARLHRIASQTWLRHFDDHLGLSHAELERHADRPAPTLPVAEPLIADRPEHRIPRPPSKALDPAHGFQLPVPELLYHHGELHNLCISRGTLTAEERFKINEHIIHTIVMLESMPFPRQLKRVPEYAGTHHETLTGTGYPRKLTADQLSVPARIMAIADIFEALTASDRPYKRAKSLSEAIAILHRLKRDQHIDPHLFDLFLSSGVYLSYARKFLAPEQIDHVDVAQYLDPASLTRFEPGSFDSIYGQLTGFEDPRPRPVTSGVSP